MKAMILAAGLGTRLRPLTNDLPKALVEINGRTLLEITIDRLQTFGVNEIIINVHHHAEKIASFLKSKTNFGIRIELSREDDLLLDTGGGLKKAARFFLENNSPDAPFILHNVDVLSTIDLRQMLQAHKEKNALATLAVQQRKSSRQLLFDENGLLVGRRIDNVDTLLSNLIPGSPSSQTCHPERSEGSAFSSNRSPATDHRPLAFSGIHIISSRLLNLITEQGVFSIIDVYLRLAASGEKISAFRADSFYWRDLGRLSDLTQATQDFQQGIVTS